MEGPHWVEVDDLAVVYERVTGLVTKCSEAALLEPTRCVGWSRKDLLFHLLLDAQRALVALAQPVATDADTDSVDYWRASGADLEATAFAHAEYVRRASLAYARSEGLVAQWVDTSTAAVSALRRADGTLNVLTQGKVLRVKHFYDTLVLEGALHLLDLMPGNDGWSVPSTVAGTVRKTLVALLGSPVPESWDDRTVALRLSGREPLTPQLRAELGSAAARVPVLR